MTWQLRRATDGDLVQIMVLEDALFEHDAWSPATMRAELADTNGYYLVAFRPEEPGRLDAYAGLRSPPGQPQADIQTIAVAEHARRNGLGRVLMLRMIEEARDRGATELFLEVRADNPGAQALYDQLGFERIAERPNYYRGGISAIIMRLTIPAPVTGLA